MYVRPLQKNFEEYGQGKSYYDREVNGKVLKNKLELRHQALFWLTGSRRLTAMQSAIKVSFELDFPPTTRRPKVKTSPGCAELTLPIVAVYGSLETVFVEALGECIAVGFSDL